MRTVDHFAPTINPPASSAHPPLIPQAPPLDEESAWAVHAALHCYGTAEEFAALLGAKLNRGEAAPMLAAILNGLEREGRWPELCGLIEHVGTRCGLIAEGSRL